MQNEKKRWHTSQKRKVNRRMALQSERPLDSTNWKILRELQRDARLSYNQLGRRVGLSAPAAAERVRKLEDAGVITGYGAQVNPAKVGLPLLALIQLHCTPGKCLLKTSSAMQHLEAFNERLGAHGTLVVNIVTSSALTNRILDWEQPDVNITPALDPG